MSGQRGLDAAEATFLPDTSCIVAAVCAWHESHQRAVAAIEDRLARGERMAVAAPALVEAYAVLTRLPPPHRVSAADALTLIRANFVVDVPIITLDGAGYRRLLEGASALAIAGGAIYDAVIAACALAGRVRTILTLNARHFARFASTELTIAAP